MESVPDEMLSEMKNEERECAAVLKYQNGAWEDGFAINVWVAQSSGPEFKSTKPTEMLGVHGGPSIIKSKESRDRTPRASRLERLAVLVISGFDWEIIP